jgi:Ni,Fe-hydrogenase I cytochrome b subunit
MKSSSFFDWLENHSTFLTLVLVLIYLVLRITGYFKPVDYKLNYISSHTNETTTEAYIFMRAITGLLSVIFLSLLLYKTYK